jgi:EAL domain-containing protein (putative c-di-GMP-specific phosphodiesterase class I)
MTTTAEGVECGKQLEALRRDGCDQAQGFLYSRAKPAAELEFRPVEAKKAVNE